MSSFLMTISQSEGLQSHNTMTRQMPLKTRLIISLIYLVLLTVTIVTIPMHLYAQDGSDDEEIIFFDDSAKEETYPSSSLQKDHSPKTWTGKVKLGGYFENETAFDLRQENPKEDMIDFRSKIFGYINYTFTNKSYVYISVDTLYWIVDGYEDRQSIEMDMYEGYLVYKFADADVKIGQQVVRWGVCDLLSVTGGINPIRYRPFIDPDTEDLRIPLPLIDAEIYFNDFTLEFFYMPIFQSAVLDTNGADTSIFKKEEKDNGFEFPFNVDNAFRNIIEEYPLETINYTEEKWLAGEIGVKLAYREGVNLIELSYFSTREDFPAIIYNEPQNVDGTTIESETNTILKYDFDRYERWGIAYKTALSGVDVRTEFAASPGRTMTKSSDINNDGVVDFTEKKTRAWQASSIELDYLDPGGDFFSKFGVQRITYISAPKDLLYESEDSIYFLGVLRLYTMENTLMPEWRVINVQSGSNQWFLSPRITYKFYDQFSMVAGMNVFMGGSGAVNTTSQEFIPIKILNENNQAFFSLRWYF
jgi:Protein of unknown function (DUF1302)